MANDTNQIAIDTDKIAKEVVSDVDAKEFEGKENIDITDVENTRAAKVARGEVIDKPTTTTKIDIKEHSISKNNSEIVSSAKLDDNNEWDTF